MAEDLEIIDENASDGKKAAAPSAGRKLTSSGKIRLDDRIEIDPNLRLKHFDVGPVRAFHAADLKVRDTTCFALVCERHLIPRHNVIEIFKFMNNPALMKIVRSGVIHWPESNQQQFAIVYDNAFGEKLLAPELPQAMGMRPDDVTKAVLKPMVRILQEFKERDFFHGSIRPSNMFRKDVNGVLENIILGDGLALPASYLQPALYETIERAQAEPIGRGEGTQADDIYAFGVSLAVMLRTTDPMHGLSDDEIIKSKIREGSYSAITGKDRFRGSMLELLRGLLHDDPGQRWTIEEIMVWMDGRRLSPKQAVKQLKAPRPLEFANEKYFRTSFLAMDLDKNPKDVQQIVEGGELEQWLTRSLEDDEAVERIKSAYKTSREPGSGAGFEERLAANIATALEPRAPIRYKSLRLMAEGIGKALVEAIVLRKDIRPYAEIFFQNIALYWANSQTPAQYPHLTLLLAKLDNCKKFIRDAKIGYGIERCAYQLSAETYCLSDKLRNYYVLSPEDMIFAFEDMCQNNNAPQLFLDRHSVAFLCAKDTRVINSYLYDLESNEEHKKIMGNLRCLANIQRRSSLPMFPGIAAAFEKNLPKVYARFHDKIIRDRLKKEIAPFIKEGNLFKMADILDNVDTSRRDMIGFKNAMTEYAILTQQHDMLTAKLEQKNGFEGEGGKEIAAIISCIIACVIIIFIAMLFFTNTNSF